MTTDSSGVTVQPADVGLKREMGLVGAMWASETSIIGSGWLFGVLAAQSVGSAAIIAWLIGGIAVVILALVFSELGAMYPLSGGAGRFPHFAFGSAAGISFGFFTWLQAVSVAPIECFAVMQYGSYYFPSIYDAAHKNVTGTGFILTIVLMAIFTAVNFLAIKMFATVNNVITWWKVAIPVLAIIVFAFKFHPGNFSAGGGFFPTGVGLKQVLAAVPAAGIVFSYLGFEQADQLAGEIKDPQRNLPRAIIGAVAIGTLIYILLQIVWIGAIPSNLLSHGFAGLSATSQLVVAPFAGLAGAVGFGLLATILRIDAFISPSGTGLIYVTSTSRVGYGLGRNRYTPFPSLFTKVDSRGVPWFGLIIAGVFGLVFLLPFPSWHKLVGLVTAASVLMYAGVPLALGALRNRMPDAERPYRTPAASVIAPLAFIIANLIIYWSGVDVLYKLGICIVLGYVIIGISMLFDSNRPPLKLNQIPWLVVYLIGMGIISWQGQYGGDSIIKATGHLTFGIDILVVAVFSLAIYYWATYSALSKGEIEDLISRQSAPDEQISALNL